MAVQRVPQRIRVSNAKGWRLPSSATFVGPSSRWRNPWQVLTTRQLRPNERYPLPDPGAFVVAHMDRHGNNSNGVRFAVPDGLDAARALSVSLFRQSLQAFWLDIDGELSMGSYLEQLVGRDLACSCALDVPCHADVLLEFANGGPVWVLPAAPS